MEERNIVREMFDGLFNIVTGPGFYTVDGVKRKKLKPYKPDTELSSQKTTEGAHVSSDRGKHNRIQQTLQGSSIGKSVENCDNQQHEDGTRCWDKNENDTISNSEQTDSKDISSDLKCGQRVRLKTGRVKQSRRNTSSECQTKKKGLSSHDIISVLQTDRHDCDSKCGSSSSTSYHTNEEVGSTQIKSDFGSIIKHCDTHCVQYSDLVLSTRRGKRKHSPNKKPRCSKNNVLEKQGGDDRHDGIQKTEQGKYVENCDNKQHEDGTSCWDQNDTVSSCEMSDTKDNHDDNSSVSEGAQRVRLKTGRAKQSQRNTSCDIISVLQTGRHHCDSKCGSSSSTFHHSNGELGSNEVKSDPSSVNKHCDTHGVQDSDLVLSTRRGKRKHSPNKKPTCSKSILVEKQSDYDLIPDEEKKFCDEKRTGPINSAEVTAEGCPLVSVPSTKEADAQSDVSTDSRASGYTKSRSAASASPNSSASRKKSPNQHKQGKLPEKRCAASISMGKGTDHSKTRKSLKRKLDVDKDVPLSIKTHKDGQKDVQRRKTVPDKASQHKRHLAKSNTPNTAVIRKRNKPRKAKEEHLVLSKKAVNSRKSPRSQQRLKQSKKTQTHTGSRLRQSATPQISTHLKRSGQKQKRTVSKRKEDVENRKHKSRPNHQNYKKTASSKQQSKAKHKQAVGKKQPLTISPKQLLLDKQQKILAEHSKQAVKVDKRNILSALCELEDKSQTFHSNDLDLFMPMEDLFTASNNPGLAIRGQGQNNHPGGVWRKLIPEN